MERDLITTTNRLQDVFSEIGGDLDLPMIVVVGSQSSGKSSVLENIVGRSFLPRGQGIVTRRPLVLQLIHLVSERDNLPAEHHTASNAARRNSFNHAASSSLPSASTGHSGAPSSSSNTSTSSSGKPIPPKQEYGEFLHIPGKRYHDFDQIRKEIENETMRIAGASKGISKQPIHLKIYSTEVLNLTLVDLPGLTKVPVGDQPTDIEMRIEKLVRDYVDKPNSIILAISPANVDLANSDSLRLARRVDSTGRRTIGVLTKLDLMDAGTNALDILNGRVYPLKLGFVGVVNRSQQDINEDVAMSQALEHEQEFFKTHPAYRNISHRCGTRYLSRTLHQVLMNHIRDKLPDMKARLNTLMGQTQQELAAYGESAFMGEGHRGSLILSLMTRFVGDFLASIDGTSPEASIKELCGGARIYYIFNDVFGHALESINPTSNLTTSDIKTAIRNSKGPRPSFGFPEVAFELLVKPQIRLLEPPSVRCVELVYEELMKVCHNCTSKDLQRYPRLHARLIEVVSELLRERLGPTSEYVQSLIEIQTSYINTNHPAFRERIYEKAQRRQNQTIQHRSRSSIEARKWPDGHLEEINETSSSHDDDSDHGSAAHLGNGRPASRGDTPKSGIASSKNPAVEAELNKIRSASASHDRKGSMSAPNAANNALYGGSQQPTVNGQRSTSSSQYLHPNPSGQVGGPSSNPKDSFLNYFFGGSNLSAGDMAASGSGPRSVRSPDTSRDDRAASNPLFGRKGHEGAAAAYDMKSLERHLDADTLPAPASAYENQQANTEDDMHIEFIQSLISTYFDITRQTIQDMVPKAVMHLLINHSRDHVQTRLVESLYKESLFGDLLHEDEALTAERTRIKALLDSYKEGFKILSEVL